jgi:hypothetical protein
MKNNNEENEKNDLSVSLIVDPKDNNNDFNSDENLEDLNNIIEFKCDADYNIKYNVLREGFVPGMELLKEKFKDFANNNRQFSYNLLCENFILYLVNKLNFYEALKENLFSKNNKNVVIENPTAFVIFLKIPQEKVNLFQNNYKVEEFEEGDHLIDENKKSKAVKVINMISEKMKFDFHSHNDLLSDEYKKNLLNIFSDLKNQNVFSF